MSAALTMKKFKTQSWENFWHKLDSNYWKAYRCSCKPTGFFPAKDDILLHPSKTKIVSCSEKRRPFLTGGESISKIF